MMQAMRTGLGLGWHEHDALFHGTERFFRPGYAANLVDQWIPALRRVFAMSPPKAASPSSGAPRRRPSTWSTKRVHEPPGRSQGEYRSLSGRR